jgi:SAM-dependent methyltransferase
MASGFDRVALAYRWMEYLTLGTALKRTRQWALDAGWMDGSRRALVLGDGDGRFTARLLRRNPQVEVEAVDLSAGMLRLLGRRCGFAGERLRARREDAREFVPEPGADLVATHYCGRSRSFAFQRAGCGGQRGRWCGGCILPSAC